MSPLNEPEQRPGDVARGVAGFLLLLLGIVLLLATGCFGVFAVVFASSSNALGDAVMWALLTIVLAVVSWLTLRSALRRLNANRRR